MKNIFKQASLLLFMVTFSTMCLASGPATKGPDEKVFVIHAPVNDLGEFRKIVRIAEKLKPYGRVEVTISTLADKGFYEIPEGSNFWYEYASYNPTPYKFFPDQRIAPFIPADFVKRNRDLLMAKAKILREAGLEGAFWSYEPNFIPASFFDKYPEMMGPRVDHPRRSNHPAFAPCIDREDTQEMYAGMVAELLRNVPEIHTFFFKTNDAGSGLCWSDWQYSGPNGPSECRENGMGERMASLMNSFKKGAEMAGKDISIYLTGSMFSDEEKQDIFANLPEGCYFQSNTADEVLSISSDITGKYPVRGILNPLEVIRGIEKLAGGDAKTVFISVRSSYDRGYDTPGVAEKLTEMVAQKISSPQGKASDMDVLRKLCREWGGESGEGNLLDAFIALDEAESYRRTSVGNASGIYWGVSARQITRPLVFNPELLSPDEESYFLSHVFNPSYHEARVDYTDIHGGHGTIPSGTMEQYLKMISDVVTMLEIVDENAPETDFIRNMALSLKIHSSIMRSAKNFSAAQVIRERNAEVIAAGMKRPDKIPTWDGDPDMQAFMGIMRDELDNTVGMISLLENGGMDMICHAKDSAHEDTFLLGPDLVDQLRTKRRIMLDHWTDIEGYLSSPFK